MDYGCAQLQYIDGSKCKVTNIKPGWIDTPMVVDYHKQHPYLGKPDHLMDPDYVAEVVMWTLEQPEHIESLTITARRNANSK